MREEKNDAVSNQDFAVIDVFVSSPDKPVLHWGGSIFGEGEAVMQWKVYHLQPENENIASSKIIRGADRQLTNDSMQE